MTEQDWLKALAAARREAFQLTSLGLPLVTDIARHAKTSEEEARKGMLLLQRKGLAEPHVMKIAPQKKRGKSGRGNMTFPMKLSAWMLTQKGHEALKSQTEGVLARIIREEIERYKSSI